MNFLRFRIGKNVVIKAICRGRHNLLYAYRCCDFHDFRVNVVIFSTFFFSLKPTHLSLIFHFDSSVGCLYSILYAQRVVVRSFCLFCLQSTLLTFQSTFECSTILHLQVVLLNSRKYLRFWTDSHSKKQWQWINNSVYFYLSFSSSTWRLKPGNNW